MAQDQTDKTFKVIIAGGRNIDDSEIVIPMLRASMNMMHQLINMGQHVTPLEVVSGGARGVDKIGEEFANGHSLKLTVFPAEWDTHGKAAGPIRNNKMASYADALIAIWDGKSRGTKHMIDTALASGLIVTVIRYG